MEAALKTYFGFSGFRSYQREIIQKVLEGRDCLVVMATGSGKSICYQIPPLVTKKTAVVVSPLLSLMQDQVMSLKQHGVKSEYLGSTQTDISVSGQAEKGAFDVLYMTPEKAVSLPSRFWSNLQAAGICLLAVDEAHCISEWGHDFRTEYKQLHMLRDLLVGVPFVALTATATQRVRGDIATSLTLRIPHIVVGSFDRPNLFYGVKSCNRSMAFINELVKDVSKNCTVGGSTIIYCTTIRETEQVHEALVAAGIKSSIYHGRMGNKAREESHRSFVRDEVLVMVATIAFGMGIDKPDVRCVIHYGCPKSLESYYQESGRCGRDGLPSVCWLYYQRSDFMKSDFYCAEAKSVCEYYVHRISVHAKVIYLTYLQPSSFSCLLF
jgi:ATP-dependent DNA helicase RecQ